MPIKNTANIEQAKVQKPYDLNQDCEVWLQNEGETETNYKRTYIMAGVVPNEVLGKTENEIKSYFKNEYPGKMVKSLSKEEIVLEDAEHKSDDKVDTMSDYNCCCCISRYFAIIKTSSLLKQYIRLLF